MNNNTRLIPLGKSGKSAIVDADDFEFINRWKWQYIKSGYANRVTNRGRGNYINVLMHRVVTSCPEGKQVDHINGNKLDNRKSNLRIVSSSQNNYAKSLASNNKSGFKGVSYESRSNKWIAVIIKEGKRKHIGTYPDPVTAAFAYNEAAEQMFGEYAKLNDLTAYL